MVYNSHISVSLIHFPRPSFEERDPACSAWLLYNKRFIEWMVHERFLEWLTHPPSAPFRDVGSFWSSQCTTSHWQICHSCRVVHSRCPTTRYLVNKQEYYIDKRVAKEWYSRRNRIANYRHRFTDRPLWHSHFSHFWRHNNVHELSILCVHARTFVLPAYVVMHFTPEYRYYKRRTLLEVMNVLVNIIWSRHVSHRPEQQKWTTVYHTQTCNPTSFPSINIEELILVNGGTKKRNVSIQPP